MNGSMEEWFRTTARVRQGCLLSPTLFNSIGGKNITNLQFADDVDAVAEEEQALEGLVESFNKTCTRYKLEISAGKTKLMTNSFSEIQR